MLAYFSYGDRHYFENPIPYMIRRFWEFQIVLEGAIDRTPATGPTPTTCPRGNMLWISPPRSDHAWTGLPGETAKIAVFHFPQVPDELKRRLPEPQHCCLPLTPQEVQQFDEIAREVDHYWQHTPPGADLCYEQARLRVGFLSFQALSRIQTTTETERPEDRVLTALRWYQEHMAEKPTLSQIASAVHSSPSHLRRLFHESHHNSPKSLFDQLRYQRALQLLTETDMTMADIAEACGFQDQSAFSRGFKKHYQCSPTEMRKPRKSTAYLIPTKH